MAFTNNQILWEIYDYNLCLKFTCKRITINKIYKHKRIISIVKTKPQRRLDKSIFQTSLDEFFDAVDATIQKVRRETREPK